jgi:hypothetical protein
MKSNTDRYKLQQSTGTANLKTRTQTRGPNSINRPRCGTQEMATSGRCGHSQ